MHAVRIEPPVGGAEQARRLRLQMQLSSSSSNQQQKGMSRQTNVKFEN